MALILAARTVAILKTALIKLTWLSRIFLFISFHLICVTFNLELFIGLSVPGFVYENELEMYLLSIFNWFIHSFIKNTISLMLQFISKAFGKPSPWQPANIQLMNLCIYTHLSAGSHLRPLTFPFLTSFCSLISAASFVIESNPCSQCSVHKSALKLLYQINASISWNQAIVP